MPTFKMPDKVTRVVMQILLKIRVRVYGKGGGVVVEI